jgi:hypothetical protein
MNLQSFYFPTRVSSEIGRFARLTTRRPAAGDLLWMSACNSSKLQLQFVSQERWIGIILRCDYRLVQHRTIRFDSRETRGPGYLTLLESRTRSSGSSSRGRAGRMT